MIEKNIFYVYIHQKLTDGKCFYVGKGTGNRYITPQSRNRYWHDIVNKHGFIPKIIINNISEEKAFELESIISRQIGYSNLCNIRKEKGWGGYSHSIESKKKTSKPIFQYDLDGNFIKEWYGATEAAKSLGKESSAITECCRGYRKSIYGFLWRHKDNPINEEQKLIPKKQPKQKYPPYYHPINQYDLDGNFIKTWNNIKQASDHLNIKSSSISNNISGKYKSAGSFIWKKGGNFA